MGYIPDGLKIPSANSPYGLLVAEASSDTDVARIALASAFQTARDDLIRSQYSRPPDALMRVAAYSRDRLLESSQAVKTMVDHDADAPISTRAAVALQTMLVEPMLVLPVLFRYPRRDSASMYYRRRVVDGMYGQIVEYAGDLLDEHEQRATDKHQRERSHVLGQLAFLGLGNRSEQGEFCALPALYREERLGWNIECYNYLKSEPRGVFTRVQVRASSQKPHTAPPHILRIYGNDFGWQRKSGPWYTDQAFATIRAMELELNGQGDASCGRVTAENGLNHLVRKVYKAINSKAAPLS